MIDYHSGYQELWPLLHTCWHPASPAKVSLVFTFQRRQLKPDVAITNLDTVKATAKKKKPRIIVCCSFCALVLVIALAWFLWRHYHVIFGIPRCTSEV